MSIRAWILTDGKAGDVNQCVGVTESLEFDFEVRQLEPRRFYSWFMPLGPIDPRDHPSRPGSPIAPPFPDIAIASGRRSVAYLRAIKSASQGRCFTVYLKDPRFFKHPGLASNAADFIWAPKHDRLSGDNVLATLTSPHRLHASTLAAARANPDSRLINLARPRIAVLLGGDSRAYQFSSADIARLSALLEMISDQGGALMVSASRRTPEALKRTIQPLTEQKDGFFWDGSGDNPFIPMLALADHIIVTADSVNMIGEALATGAPVHIFRQSGGSRKTSAFLDKLSDKGMVRNLAQHLETWSYKPVNSTPEIAADLLRRFSFHRRSLR